MGGGAGQHSVEVRADEVVKRYRSSEHGQPERKWRALSLLDRYAPGVAPVPVSAELRADPPTVVMSRLDGTRVNGPIRGRLADALAQAIDTMQRAIPRRVLERLPPRAGHPAEFLQQVRASVRGIGHSGGETVVNAAIRQAVRWVEQVKLEQVLGEQGTRVFGTGDGNLTNYLWDGTRIRVIDFEYSGSSDRLFELAEIIEHISVWRNDIAGMTAVLERFDLAPGEVGRLTQCRRLLALYWLLRTQGQSQCDQASRMLALL